ncbi:MAG: hypothetical protein ACTHNW_08995 [Mucilaginibacter sp.]
MATFYLILEIAAFLGVIIFPLAGPKKAKTQKRTQELSNLFVNEQGYLEYINDDQDHLPVH